MNAIVILCDTLRRDHVGAYHLGRPLNQCWSREAPDWVVPTPQLDRLAARSTVFDNCYAGSTPCMPARRDLYTGRYEFLERGWGPLEDDDADLPRQVSGPPNQSLTKSLAQGHRVSYLVSDHFHLWEQGAGNYHMGYSGFDFVRGCEADAWRTDPVEFPCPPGDRLTKNERHWRNVHLGRRGEEDYFCAQTFRSAATWLEENHRHENFYLHLDIFDPHEPWDPPEDLLKRFDPRGYAVDGVGAAATYAPWRDTMDASQLLAYRARYAAKVVFLDRWLGVLLDAMDRLDLWKNTMVVLTTDHGTFNGDHGRMGKLQTHEFDAKSHIPFILHHPHAGHGERRDQLVQLVDLYPTVLSAVNRPLPERTIHGVNLLPAVENPGAQTRSHALCGMFGQSVSITDGRTTLHQSPRGANGPLSWYGHPLARFIPYPLGDFEGGRRPVENYLAHQEATWLSDKIEDPNELENLADAQPERVAAMQAQLKGLLPNLGLPGECAREQIQRLGL